MLLYDENTHTITLLGVHTVNPATDVKTYLNTAQSVQAWVLDLEGAIITGPLTMTNIASSNGVWTVQLPHSVALNLNDEAVIMVRFVASSDQQAEWKRRVRVRVRT